jgi:hypothetical protein
VLPSGERRLRIMTDSWELQDPFIEIIGTIKDLIAIHFPILDRYHRWLRARRAEWN